MRNLLDFALLGLCSLGACSGSDDGGTANGEPAGEIADGGGGDDASNEDSATAREASPRDSGAAQDSPAAPFQPPDDWPRVQGNCGISLRAPAMVATPSRGVDSCVASFEGPDCSYSAEIGGFSDPLTHYDGDPRYSVETVRLGDKNARLVTSLQRLEDQRYFVAIHVPGPIPGGSSSTSATVAVFCFSAAGRDTARSALQTLELPRSEADWLAPLPETVSCVGEDIRPVSGYRLGKACVDSKGQVPSVCALGARAHASFGNGPMMCFLSSAGEYFWAHVAYGEVVAGPGTRHGRSQTLATELTEIEEARCMMLVEMLGDHTVDSVSGEYSYGACP